LLLKINDQQQIINEGCSFDFKTLEHTAYIETLEDVELLCISCGNYFDQYSAHYEDVDKIISILEKRDLYTRQHSENVLGYAARIGMVLGLNQLEIKDLMIASKFHDIGKIEISLEILNKNGKLTDEEYDLMKGHPQASYQLLKGVFGERIATMALQHHERIDGSGYPHRLKGDEIVLEAKIICVADVIDAMLSKRVYREALPLQVVKDELINGRGVKYDQKVVDVALSSFFADSD
jgi:HD-GYP domain-containing protein (c-di-GMP phosphodiesterase class II)